MAKKEPYDMTNNYARMERDKRKAIRQPQQERPSQEERLQLPEGHRLYGPQHLRPAGAGEDVHHHEVLIGVVFVALVGGAGAAQHRVEG